MDVYVTNGGNSPIPLNNRSGWQQKLCNVVVDVCQLDGGTKVKSSAIRTKHNNLLYLQLRVHGNHTFVGNTLQWREIGFVIEIKGHQKQMVKKHFAIDLHSQRFRRSTCTRFCLGAISWRSNFFPDYDQHKCCGDCWSGCSPVAWAQVFGYYDSLGSILSSPYSGSVYGDIYTMAPKKLDPHKKDPATMKVKSLMEDIRSKVLTFCNNGQGSTYSQNMHLIAPWFRARQGYRARVVSYLERSKKRSVTGATFEYGSRSWILSKGVEWLKKDYPVVFEFKTARGGHAVVATMYAETVKRYRHCENSHTGWFWGRRTKTVCSWKSDHSYQLYLHYGWGGSNNGWQTIDPYGAHVAYLNRKQLVNNPSLFLLILHLSTVANTWLS